MHNITHFSRMLDYYITGKINMREYVRVLDNDGYSAQERRRIITGVEKARKFIAQEKTLYNVHKFS